MNKLLVANRSEIAIRCFRAATALAAGPVLLLGAVGGALLSHRALRPIRRMITTVRSIAAGAFDARVTVRRTGDELDELGRVFNGMLDRIASLEHVIARLRRLEELRRLELRLEVPGETFFLRGGRVSRGAPPPRDVAFEPEHLPSDVREDVREAFRGWASSSDAAP